MVRIPSWRARLIPFGNTGAASLSFTLDTTAPSGGTPSPVVAFSNTDNITAATTPTFTVALSPSVAVGDKVQLLLDGSPLAHPVTHVITAADVPAGSVEPDSYRRRPRG